MRKFYRKKIRSEVKLTLKTVLLGGYWMENPIKLKKLLKASNVYTENSYSGWTLG